jgi:hypothetical protein
MVQGRQAQAGVFRTNFSLNLVGMKNIEKEDYCKKVGNIV